jgi:glycosyltransferase involved in cell wall biosynthesis
MTVNNPLVSVVMGTYNGGKFLREQLDSIFAQTYTNLEVVVCDDCSTDDTVEILEEFSRKFGLTYHLNEKNLGLVRNYEKVLSLAKGEYLALSDQDDIWFPNKIELLLSNIGSCSLIHSAVRVIDSEGKPHRDPVVISELSKDHTAKVHFADFLETAWMLGCTSLLDRKLLVDCLPFPEGVMFHDWWLTMAAIELGNGIKYIHVPTVKYRQYGGNTALNFFMDITWHKKRFEFYKLLASKFEDKLSPEEKTLLKDIAYKNAVNFTWLGIQKDRRELVSQFLQDNPDLFTLPFIQELISTAEKNVRGESIFAGQASNNNPELDPAYQFMLSFRRKIFLPVSPLEKIIWCF